MKKYVESVKTFFFAYEILFSKKTTLKIQFNLADLGGDHYFSRGCAYRVIYCPLFVEINKLTRMTLLDHNKPYMILYANAKKEILTIARVYN